MKKASQVFYLHFALKKRAFIEEIHEKQELVCIQALNIKTCFTSLSAWLSFDVVFFEI